jgi:hypothetical protein
MVRLGIEAPVDVKVFREEVVQNGADKTLSTEPRTEQCELHHRLSDAAEKLSTLRLQLRGKVPATASAALFQIDRDLNELARQVETTAARKTAAKPDENLTFSATI